MFNNIEWQEVKSKQTKVKNDNDGVKHTLVNFLNNNDNQICVYSILKRCRNKDNCDRVHLDKNFIEFNLNKIILDPTRIPGIKSDRNQIIDTIKNNDVFNKKTYLPFLTACTFALNGDKCINHSSGRIITVQLDFNGKKIPITICYPDFNKCKERITCGFHLDFSFTIDYIEKKLVIHDVFKIESIVDNVDNENNTLNPIIPIMDDKNFPSLVSSTKTQSIISTQWNSDKLKLTDSNISDKMIEKQVDEATEKPVDTKVTEKPVDAKVTEKPIDEVIGSTTNTVKVNISTQITKKKEHEINHRIQVCEDKQNDYEESMIINKDNITIELQKMKDTIAIMENKLNTYENIVEQLYKLYGHNNNNLSDKLNDSAKNKADDYLEYLRFCSNESKKNKK